MICKYFFCLNSLSIRDYLSYNNNKSIFSSNSIASYTNELDNDEDIFDVSNNNNKPTNSHKHESCSNSVLNTSSISSGYESSKLSSSDTNQTLSGSSSNRENGNGRGSGIGHSSSSSSSASNLNTALSTENVSWLDSPELLIKTGNKKSIKHFYGSNHNLKGNLNSAVQINNSSSRARLAHENLQRLEREKDDLYEL